MPTYRQKIEELRLKSLRIIEKGLSDESSPAAFTNAVLFMNFNTSDVLDKEITEEPDALDAKEIVEKEKE